MRFGIDARPLEGKRTGTGRYIFEVCKTLDRLGGAHEYFLYAKGPFEMPVEAPNWHARVEPDARARGLMSLVWLKTRAGRLARADGLDAFWAAGGFYPGLSRGTRRVVTVYDLTHVLFPRTMARQTLWGYRLFFRRDLLRSDGVSSISEGTARRVAEHYRVESDAVVHPPIAEMFSRAGAIREDQVRAALDALGIRRPYVLAVGTAEPRKNLEALIGAFSGLAADPRFSGHKLVLVGGKGWRDGPLARLVEREAARVTTLGYVGDEELLCVYRGATLFVFPSLYEGYGIPLTEALLCGVPALATDSPEIREAGGEGCIYVGPSMEAIRTGLVGALSGEGQAGGAPSYDRKAEVASLLALLEGGR